MNEAQCACGAARFQVGTPLFRLICHCSICQAFNDAPFADVAVYRAGDVTMPASDAVAYRHYSKLPILKRGRCVACSGPAIEFSAVPLAPTVVVVPRVNVPDSAPMPEPSMHLFYESRVTDMDDGVAKYSGFLPSQVATVTGIVRALWSRSRD